MAQLTPDDRMADLFDFGAESIPVPGNSPAMLMQLDEGDFLADLTGTEFVQSSFPTCTIHPGENCLCHTLITDLGLDESQCAIPIEPVPDYANFAAYIPRYSKPEKCCEYCAQKNLQCFFTYDGQKFCSPCSALFRSCSFVDGPRTNVVHMDTLQVVQEDIPMDQGEVTGIAALKSFDRTAFEVQTVEDDGPSVKTGTRFPRAAVKILKDWMDQHRDNPYPTEEEKDELKTLTGLKSGQISNWFANTRRRTKTKSRGVSPSIRSPAWPTTSSASTSAAMNIPFDKKEIRHNGKTWDRMTPFERWQHSPPENEPASVTDIAQALSKTKSRSQNSSLSSRVAALDSSPGSSFSHRAAPSLISLETGMSDSLLSSGSLSNLSLESAMSHGSLNSRGRDKRRRRRTAANPSRNVNAKVAEVRPFQCTFCTDRFRTKYDWSRHEKSLHLSLEKWICAPLGPVVTTSSTGLMQCVYCGEANPTEEHIETHNHRACEEKGMDARTFYRKDHLRQHLRLVHNCKLSPSMESWKSEATFVRSRCGFCKQEFTKWQDRVDHLSKHFRAGLQMKDWKGCRGLDPAVAAQVTNAMPPYLIGNEAKSPYPFSASNEATWRQNTRFTPAGADLGAAIPTSPNWDDLIGADEATENAHAPTLMGHHAQTMMRDDGSGLANHAPFVPSYMTTNRGVTGTGESSPRAITCWEILTVRLGQYVKDQVNMGTVPTDEMLQRQARWLLYEDDDSWNQTAADNQEWLQLFKKAHGLPSTADHSRVDVDEDLGAQLADMDFDKFLLSEGIFDSSGEPLALNEVAFDPARCNLFNQQHCNLY
ncbi:Homeobox protein TGIF1 [Venturia nashicola]|uniref:Homeobox protein TGIF1 n=1 Tax=Venturia nashicola TaxID=86259 RepID=A0A4Z1NBY1_9PEZI|nr:Homeobox protein TGIF1 [Venturia nashicola]